MIATEIKDHRNAIRAWIPALGTNAALVFNAEVTELSGNGSNNDAWEAYGSVVNVAPISGIAVDKSINVKITIYRVPATGYSDGKDRICRVDFHYGIHRQKDNGFPGSPVTDRMRAIITAAVTAVVEKMAPVLHPHRNVRCIEIMRIASARSKRSQLIKDAKELAHQLELIGNQYAEMNAKDLINQGIELLTNKDSQDEDLLASHVAELRKQVGALASVFIGV